MKNTVLFEKLRETTRQAKENELKEIQLKEKKEKEAERKEMKKRVEKKLKNIEQEMLNSASNGHPYHVVEMIWLNTTKSKKIEKCNKIEEWTIELQETYKLLEERGFDPEIRKRSDGDQPSAYSVGEVPYVIAVSWEE